MLLRLLEEDLAARAAAGLKRQRRVVETPAGVRLRVDGREVLAFGSNDYLGLANHPKIAAALQQGVGTWGVGAGASHLLTGHYAVHEELEQALAQWVGLPRALAFSTGYLANLGVIPALVGRNDAVFGDRLNHASLHDGALLARAEFERYAHNDVADLARRLEACPARRKLVATDAVFSMDGDLAPLRELLAVAEAHDAWLLVDDAHGFGVLGEGRGALAHFGLASPRLIYMGTLGKAAGVCGAFVAGTDTVIETLLQSARSYVFTTASPPALARAACASLEVMRDEPQRHRALASRIAQLKEGLAGTRWSLLPSDTPIQPLLVGDNESVLALSAALWEQGFWVPAIRPPTVPKGTARLRISLSAEHGAADVAALTSALRRL
ncbi:MAG: 8-amino-7-oxononanoate synthase [Betaproteobacteria bacterium]|nr:8-amino-7-oxononanoate synthase [Betaproteobacteria bacterium]